ncbi:MAG: hypothetical protein KIT09_17160 [Bryobacteraceae bacterium]|nr:hypothetical protein [Bryobacteraceae bacterium]
MKRRHDAVVPSEILESARRSVMTDRSKPAKKCSVCGSDCTRDSNEDLCWVCRRLKISAWGDTDHQMPAQE